MRIVFIGTVNFSERLLKKLIDIGAEVVGVITKERSSFNADFTDLAPVAKEHGIPYIHVSDINDHKNAQWIRSLRPDVIFCFGISQILKRDILKAAPMGAVGFHPARLPANRGRHPLIWALALGLKEIAATFFFMDEGADSGDIISQEDIGIAPDDDAGTLYRKVALTAERQLEKLLPALAGKDLKRVPQDPSKATYWRKRYMKDGELDFRMNKDALYDLVRALTHPYAGAHILYKGSVVKVWEAEKSDAGSENDEYGKILNVSGAGILVKCHDGAILLKKHEFKVLPKTGEYFL